MRLRIHTMIWRHTRPKKKRGGESDNSIEGLEEIIEIYSVSEHFHITLGKQSQLWV
jgi:hypothetical protein